MKHATGTAMNASAPYPRVCHNLFFRITSSFSANLGIANITIRTITSPKTNTFSAS